VAVSAERAWALDPSARVLGRRLDELGDAELVMLRELIAALIAARGGDRGPLQRWMLDHADTESGAAPDQRSRLREEVARLRDSATSQGARVHFEHMLRRLDEGAEIITAGQARWMAGTAEDLARIEAEQQAAVEAARRGRLDELGWVPAAEGLADELRRRGLA
jgi:hypothetical protein